jgi:hypothetical protein
MNIALAMLAVIVAVFLAGAALMSLMIWERGDHR